MKKLLDKVINIIYPPKCIFCQQLLGHDVGAHICDLCYSKLPFMKMEVMPAFPQAEDNYCNGVVSVFEYAGLVKESLIRFKFYNEPGYYKTYGGLIADKLDKLSNINDYQLVMSVPLHKQREYSRGYNQAYLISRELSRKIKLRESSGIFKRTRYTESQSLLDRHKRAQNVKGAFTVTKPGKIKGKTILLVDDILTTGSTIEECSRVLKEAGATRVIAVVVATGRRY